MTTETLDTSAQVAELAKKINGVGSIEGVDLEMLQKVVPAPMAAAILRLGQTCCHIDSRVADLERQVKTLKAFAIASKGPPPMERGMTFFANGDAIPSKSLTDLLAGEIHVLDGIPLRFTKNMSGRRLKRGEAYHDGVVDTQLRRDEVEANDFFYVEVC